MADEKPKPGIYKVLESLGFHTAGQLVEITEEHVKNGVDIARLKALKVIEEVENKPKNATVVPIGYAENPDNRLQPFPVPPKEPAKE